MLVGSVPTGDRVVFSVDIISSSPITVVAAIDQLVALFEFNREQPSLKFLRSQVADFLDKEPLLNIISVSRSLADPFNAMNHEGEGVESKQLQLICASGEDQHIRLWSPNLDRFMCVHTE